MPLPLTRYLTWQSFCKTLKPANLPANVPQSGRDSVCCQTVLERSVELSRRLFCLATLFATAMAVAWTIDIPVASYFRLDTHPELFHKLVSFAEVFGHGLGVTWILLTVYVLDVHRRCRLPRIVAAIVGAGLSANLVKLTVGRIRPRELAVDQVWDSFVGWFPKFRPEIRLGLSCQRLPIDTLRARGGRDGSGNWTLHSLSTRPMAFCLFRGSGLVAARRNLRTLPQRYAGRCGARVPGLRRLSRPPPAGAMV